MSYYASVAWAFLSGDSQKIDKLRKRIVSNLLPSGLIRTQAVIEGSIESSYAVQRVLRGYQVSQCNPSLVSALDQAKNSTWSSNDAIAKAIWIVVRIDLGAPPRRQLIEATAKGLDRELTRPITVDSAKQWSVAARLASRMGKRVESPAVGRWSLQDRAGILAATYLVNTLEDLRLSTKAASWIAPGDLVKAFNSGDLVPTNSEYFDSLRTFVVLGGTLTQEQMAIARRRVETSRCSTLPHLIRSTAQDIGCDLRSTYAALEAQRTIGNLNLKTDITP
jgi:hypothetical protein